MLSAFVFSILQNAQHSIFYFQNKSSITHKFILTLATVTKTMIYFLWFLEHLFFKLQ